MPPAPGTVSKREHFKAELRLMARAFFPIFFGVMVMFGLIYAMIIATSETQPDAPSKLALVPVAFVYGAVVGVVPACIVASIRLSWKLVGPWTLVPIILIPGAIALSLWLSADMLTGLAVDIKDAAFEVGAKREWLVLGFGRGAAHGGAILLVFLLPLLLIDLGAIALAPSVLWAMFVLVLAFMGVVVLAAIPSGLVSLVVLLRGYFVRLRRRIAEREAAAMAGPSSA